VSPKDNASKYPSTFTEPGRNNKDGTKFFLSSLVPIVWYANRRKLFKKKKKGMASPSP